MLTTMPNRPAPTDTASDPRYAAVVARDKASDNRFWYGVLTTGVYCRPSCAARTPRAENVRFFDSCDAAEGAGLRACKRCRPRGDTTQARQAALVAKACRAIEAAEAEPSLDALAASAGLSPFHFHRVFKTVTGLTPKAWAQAERARRMREGLSGGERVTTALYDAGYGSSSRFYERSDGILGMTPKRFRDGGRDTDIRFAIAQSTLGAVLVACSDRGVVAISLGDDAEALARELQDRFPRANLIGGDAGFEATVARVIAFVERPQQGFGLPLDIQGTAFQQRVWQALREIPAGETATYADIAARIGDPRAVRAVAGACAANTLAVAIPCHRVVRTDGSLSGYRWGVERKRALLTAEGAR